MFKKVFLALFVLLAISNVSAHDHFDQSTDDIEITNYPTVTITQGEQGGSITVEYQVTGSPDVSDGRGAVELALITEDGTNLVSGVLLEEQNIEGGRSYEVTFNGLRGDYLTESHCGNNRMYMQIDDTYRDNHANYPDHQLFQGEDGDDGNLQDGNTDTFGRLSVQGGDCEPVNQAPNADFEITPDPDTEVGVSTRVHVDGSISTDDEDSSSELDYEWNIEDIGDRSGSYRNFWYYSPGERDVTLTVTDTSGKSNSITKTVNVQETDYYTEPGDVNPSGRYMYKSMQFGNPDDYHYWELSNDRWDVSWPDEPGMIMLREYDGSGWCGETFCGNDDEIAEYKGKFPSEADATQGSLADLSQDSGSNPHEHVRGSDINCNDDTCNILNMEFNSDEGALQGGNPSGVGEDSDGAIGFFPSDASYRHNPTGDIAAAWTPNVFRNKDMNAEKRFFVCRSDSYYTNPMSDGMVIDKAPKKFNQDGKVEQAADLYRCDSQWGNSAGWRGEEGGVWRPVAECNDGLDNDGDGNTDYPNDPGCDSSTDNSEASSPNSADCTPVIDYKNGDYVAYYGGVPDGNGYCDGSRGNTETFTEWTASLDGSSESEPPAPEIFTCDESFYEDTNFEIIGGSYCDDRSYGSHDMNTSKDSSQIDYVRYYPTTGYLREAVNLQHLYHFNVYVADETESHFVDRNGWRPAYMALDDSPFSLDGGVKPSYRKGAEYLYGPENLDTHNDTYWFNQVGLVDGDGNGYTDGSYNDSWVVANAGAPNNDRISSEFPGGWAGKCPEGTEWRIVSSGSVGDEWRCSGQPDWKQAVFLPEITSGSDIIGMMVMPYNFKNKGEVSNTISVNLELSSWKAAYDNVADQSASGNQDLEQMKVSCYPGETAPDYSSASEGTDYFNKTVDIPGTDISNPIGVYGEVDMSDASTYTCEWEYTTVGGEPETVNEIGCVIELQKTDSTCVNNVEEIKNYYFGNESDPEIGPKMFAEETSLERKKYSASDFKELVNVNREAEGLEALN